MIILLSQIMNPIGICNRCGRQGILDMNCDADDCYTISRVESLYLPRNISESRTIEMQAVYKRNKTNRQMRDDKRSNYTGLENDIIRNIITTTTENELESFFQIVFFYYHIEDHAENMKKYVVTRMEIAKKIGVRNVEDLMINNQCFDGFPSFHLENNNNEEITIDNEEYRCLIKICVLWLKHCNRRDKKHAVNDDDEITLDEELYADAENDDYDELESVDDNSAKTVDEFMANEENNETIDGNNEIIITDINPSYTDGERPGVHVHYLDFETDEEMHASYSISELKKHDFNYSSNEEEDVETKLNITRGGKKIVYNERYVVDCSAHCFNCGRRGPVSNMCKGKDCFAIFQKRGRYILLRSGSDLINIRNAFVTEKVSYNLLKDST